MNKQLVIILLITVVMTSSINYVYADVAENFKDFAEKGREAQMNTATELERLNEKLADHQEKLLEICEMYEEDNAMDELDEETLTQCNELLNP